VITPRKKYFLYLLSFAEGGAVMATELIGARLLAPYFGTSLYVWTSVMALTLTGLASGYFLGGRLSRKNNHEKILFSIVLLASLYIFCLPLLASFFLYLATSAPLLPAVLLSSLIVLFPPVFMMGMVSPLLIASLTSTKEESGRRAGEIYAVSTLGGICFTFLTGFYTVPVWGLEASLFTVASILVIFPLLYFSLKKFFLPFILVAFFVSAIVFFSSHKTNSLFVSEGLLGKLEVSDDLLQGSDSCRLLLIDNVIQSCTELRSGKSKLEYTDLLQKNLSQMGRKPKRTLILGLGGGVLANELAQDSCQVTAIELDKRIVDVAKKYFHLDPSVQVIQDDARHALYKIDGKFDLIVLDLFRGETSPTHVLSLESFERMKELLSEDGFIFINTYGYLHNPASAGNLLLLRTFQQAGLFYRICYVGDKTNEDYRNLEIFISKTPIKNRLQNELDESIPSLAKLPVNTDDRPVLEYASASAARQWRHSYLQNFIRYKGK
jgi:predicted membrane-bound spermidine synthase